MQKYKKPMARNLGDLQPALGLCSNGQSAGYGDDFGYCAGGLGASSPPGDCTNGNYASGNKCQTGTSASNACTTGNSFGAYPYG